MVVRNVVGREVLIRVLKVDVERDGVDEILLVMVAGLEDKAPLGVEMTIEPVPVPVEGITTVADNVT